MPEHDKVIIHIPGFGYYRVHEEQVSRFQQLIRLAAQEEDAEAKRDTLELAAFRALQDQTGTGVKRLMAEFESPPNGVTTTQPGEKIFRFDESGEIAEEVASEAMALDLDEPQEKPQEKTQQQKDDERGRQISQMLTRGLSQVEEEPEEEEEAPPERRTMFDARVTEEVPSTEPARSETESTEARVNLPGAASRVPASPEVAQGVNEAAEEATQEAPVGLSEDEISNFFRDDPRQPVRPQVITAPQLQRVAGEVGEGDPEKTFEIASQIVTMEQRDRALNLQKEEFGRAFSRGIEQAIRRPFQIFGVDPEVHELEVREGVEALERDTTGEVAGELSASLGVFLTGYGLTGTALRGVGLASRMTPLSTMMTQSALTGAMMGAGATPPDELEQLPWNMAKEAALWAAGDAAILALTGKMGKLALEGRKIKGVTRQVRGKPIRESDFTVPPIYLNLDRALHPNGAKNTREMVDRIIALADSGGDNPYGAAAGVLANRSERQFGVVVLEAATKKEADELLAGLKSVDEVGLQYAQHGNRVIAINEAELPYVHVRQDLKTGRVRIIRQSGIKNNAQIYSAEKMSPEELVQAVRAGVANHADVAPLEIEVVDAARTAGRYRFDVGDKGVLRRKIEIEIADDASAEEIISVLAHEAAHDMMVVALGKAPERSGLLKSLFGIGDAGKKELREVMIRNLMRRRGISRSAARRAMVAGEGLTDDFELVAGFIELLSLDPKLAARLAPKAGSRITKFVMQRSPLVRAMVTGDRLVYTRTLDEYLKTLEGRLANSSSWRTVDSFQRRWRKVVAQQQEVTPKLLKQFEAEGAFEGMPVWYNGMRHEFVRNLGKGKVLIRETRVTKPRKGQAKVHRTVDANKVQHATMENMLKMEGDVRRIVGEVARRGLPEILGATVRRGGQLLRLQFRTKDFVRLKGEGIEAIETWMKNSNPHIDISDMSPGELRNAALQAAKDAGSRGLIVDDLGSVRVYMNNPTETAAIHYFDEGVKNVRATSIDEGVIELTGEDILTQALYQRGITLSDAEHLARLMEEERLTALVREIDVGGEFTQGYEAAVENWDSFMKSLDFLNVDGADDAVRAGMLYDRLPDGSVVVRVDPYGLGQPGGTALQRFDDVEKAQAYIARLDPSQQPQNYINIPGLTPQMTRGLQAVGGTVRPKVGQMADDMVTDQAKMADRVVNKLGEWKNEPSLLADDVTRKLPETLLGAKDLSLKFLTAMKPIAQAFEKEGFGPAFTVIYQKSQDAMETVKRAILDTNVFDGKSYSDRLHGLRNGLLKLNPDRRALVTQLNMAISRDELLSGSSVFGRGFNDTERKLVEFIELAGMSDDVPMLVSQFHSLRRLARQGNDLIDAAKQELRGIQTVDRSYNLKLADLDNEAYAALSEVERMKVLADLKGMSKEQISLLDFMHRNTIGQDVDVNFFAVSRYFSINQGMSRQQFIRKFNMTKEEVALADEMMEIMAPAFEDGMQGAQEFMRGVFPEASRWITNGQLLNRQVMGEYFDRGGFFLHQGMEAGDISAYIRDPVQLAYRTIRTKMMQKHWDPVYSNEIQPALTAMKNLAESTGNRAIAKAHDNMYAYVRELQGVPHGSFEWLDNMVTSMFSKMGATGIHPNIASDLTRKMMMLTYKAFIPFRPLLLIRNLFEVSRLGGVVGGKDLGYGIRHVLQNRKAAYEAAVKAGAIKPDAPVFPVDNAAYLGFATYGSTTRPMLDKALRGAQRLGSKINDVSEIGMGFYQDVDDMSRAIAFHSMKRRVSKHLDLAQRDFAAFKSKAKINTFDDTEIAEFTKIWQRNQQEAVDYISRQFADNSLFLYGNANHPLHWNSLPGVMFGQFGTWPVQYAQWMMRGMTRGSARDRLQFAGWNIGMFWAMVEAGDEAGIDLRSYWGMSSFPYTGGPWAGIVTDAMQSMGGNEAERALARASLSRQLDPTNFPSPYLPLSAAVNDVYDAVTQYDNPIRGSFHEFVVPQTRE